MFRVSIKQALIAIAVVGLLLATLRFASPRFARVLFDLVLVFLALSVLLAIYGGASRRAFWGGFAIFGWLMLAVTQFHVLFANGQTFNMTDDAKWSFHPLDHDNLPTSLAARRAYDILLPSLTLPTPPTPTVAFRRATRQFVFAGQAAGTQFPDGSATLMPGAQFHVVEGDFLAVADCWWVLLAGGVGGGVAAWLARRNRDPGRAQGAVIAP